MRGNEDRGNTEKEQGEEQGEYRNEDGGDGKRGIIERLPALRRRGSKKL